MISCFLVISCSFLYIYSPSSLLGTSVLIQFYQSAKWIGQTHRSTYNSFLKKQQRFHFDQWKYSILSHTTITDPETTKENLPMQLLFLIIQMHIDYYMQKLQVNLQLFPNKLRLATLARVLGVNILACFKKQSVQDFVELRNVQPCSGFPQ